MQGTIITLIILVGALIWFFVALARQRMLKAQPTSKLGSVQPGYAELQGLSRGSHDGDLLDPIEHKRCLWFRIETFRQEQRVTRDARTGRRRVHNEWVKIDEAESSRPFLFEDGTGRCMIAPAGAKIEVPRSTVYVGNRFLGRGIRHYIWRIGPSESLFALGQLHSTVHDGERLLRLEKPRDNSVFLITNRTEQQMLRSSKLQQIVAGAVGSICILALFSSYFGPLHPTQASGADASAPRLEQPSTQSAPAARPSAPSRTESLLVEKPKPLASYSEAEQSTFERRRRWIDQLRANQAYAGFDTAPPMLSVVDRGPTVVVTNNAPRSLSLHIGRLSDWSNAGSRLCILRAPTSGADGATTLKSREKATFELPSGCPTRGSLDYRIGSHADLDAPDAIGWWSKSALDREDNMLKKTVGS